MTTPAVDYEGSYLLGEADGEMWASQAHRNDAQALALLSPDEIGQRDIFGQDNAAWLRDQAESYAQQDAHFDGQAYFEGFLASVKRAREAFVFSVAGARRRC